MDARVEQLARHLAKSSGNNPDDLVHMFQPSMRNTPVGVAYDHPSPEPVPLWQAYAWVAQEALGWMKASEAEEPEPVEY